MKIVIIRTHGSVVDLNTYNSQDLGMAKAFIATGNQCDIVYYGGNKKTHIQKIEVTGGNILIYWVRGISLALNGIFFGLSKIIKEYDVIQVGDYDQLTSLWLIFFSRYRNKTVLYHGPYLCEYNKKYRMKCRVVDLFPFSQKIKKEIPCFAKSKFAANFLLDRGFCNITTVGVGLDRDRFANESYQDDVTKKIINFVSNTNAILYVGRIEKRRNTIFLIELLEKVKAFYPEVKMVLIGDGDVDYKRKCALLAKKLGLTDNICYIKKIEQSQLRYIYEACSIFLLPTSYEIFGMVLMEAMHYGLPVITTYNGGSSTIIDSECGIVCDLDINKWSIYISELLNDKEKCKYLGNNAKKVVEERCSWNKIVNKMMEQYPKVK